MISYTKVLDTTISYLAEMAGFEPATNRLTADCSTTELHLHWLQIPESNWFWATYEDAKMPTSHLRFFCLAAWSGSRDLNPNHLIPNQGRYQVTLHPDISFQFACTDLLCHSYTFVILHQKAVLILQI